MVADALGEFSWRTAATTACSPCRSGHNTVLTAHAPPTAIGLSVPARVDDHAPGIDPTGESVVSSDTRPRVGNAVLTTRPMAARSASRVRYRPKDTANIDAPPTHSQMIEPMTACRSPGSRTSCRPPHRLGGPVRSPPASGSSGAPADATASRRRVWSFRTSAERGSTTAPRETSPESTARLRQQHRQRGEW